MPAMLEIQPYSDGHTKYEKNDPPPPPPPPNLTPSSLPSKRNLVPPSVPPQISFDEKADPNYCSSPPIVEKVESIT